MAKTARQMRQLYALWATALVLGRADLDGADNAAILAAQILALGEPELAGRLEAEKRNMARQVLQKDAEIQEKVAAL